MSFALGQKIKVKGKSQKGKSRVQQWGDDWIVEQLGPNPDRIGIVSITDPSANKDKGLPDSFRWVDLPDDSDVAII